MRKELENTVFIVEHFKNDSTFWLIKTLKVQIRNGISGFEVQIVFPESDVSKIEISHFGRVDFCIFIQFRLSMFIL